MQRLRSTRAEANLPPLKSKAERYKELVAIKAVSQQDYDDATAAVKQAEAQIAGQQGSRGDGAHQPGLYKDHGSYIGANRQIPPDRGRTCHRAPGDSPSRPFSSSTPSYVDATQSSANLLAFKRNLEAGKIRGAGSGQARVKLFLEDGTPYPMGGNSEILRRHSGAQHRVIHSPNDFPEPQAYPSSGHVRKARGS